MAELQHPHIVRLLTGKVNEDGWHYFVMEYLPGGNLEQAVLDGRLLLEERRRVLVEVGEALAFAHQHGVVHRDVKPANILLDGGGRAKLTDFDLVRAEDTTGLTATQAMMGTVQFAAPEALGQVKDVGPPADVYSLGATAVFTFLGKRLPPLFFRDPARCIDELECSTGMKFVLRRAMASDFLERQTVMEFCRDLAEPAMEHRFDDLNLAHMKEQAVREALRRCGKNQTEAAKLLGISRASLSRRINKLPQQRLALPTLFSFDTLNLQQLEERAVREALRRCGKNQTQAAKLLGISRQALRRRMERLLL